MNNLDLKLASICDLQQDTHSFSYSDSLIQLNKWACDKGPDSNQTLTLHCRFRWRRLICHAKKKKTEDSLFVQEKWVMHTCIPAVNSGFPCHPQPVRTIGDLFDTCYSCRGFFSHYTWLGWLSIPCIFSF